MNNIFFIRIKFFTLLLIPLLYSCQKTIENKGVVKNIPIENFESFFLKFSSNPKFQSERIRFPLKTYSYDIDNESPSISILDRKQWEFSKLNSNKFLKKIRKINYRNCIVEIQILDTGVFVEYYFTKEKDKWYLIKIVDKST